MIDWQCNTSALIKDSLSKEILFYAYGQGGVAFLFVLRHEIRGTGRAFEASVFKQPLRLCVMAVGAALRCLFEESE